MTRGCGLGPRTRGGGGGPPFCGESEIKRDDDSSGESAPPVSSAKNSWTSLQYQHVIAIARNLRFRTLPEYNLAHFPRCAYSAHMNRDDLPRSGALLYGERWQSELARDIGVHHRTVQRWATQEVAMPEAMLERVAALLRRRRGEIDDVLEGE